MSTLGQRLGKLEDTARSRRADRGPALLFVSPDDWPAEDRDAFDVAGEVGDRAARAALIARHTGERLGPATMVILIRDRPDGPQ